VSGAVVKITDITPANKLGIKCVWVNRAGRLLGLSGEGASEAKPDLIVSSLEELVTVVIADSQVTASLDQHLLDTNVP